MPPWRPATMWDCGGASLSKLVPAAGVEVDVAMGVAEAARMRVREAVVRRGMCILGAVWGVRWCGFEVDGRGGW
jgi:hypothetical protein